jgi:hypothetical protein
MPVVAARRLLAVLVLAVVVAMVAALPAAAQTTSTKCTLYAVLKAGNEVNPSSNSQASGASLVHIDGSRVSFTTVIANPARETFTLGHIHRGVAGMNGGVVVDFFNGMSTRRLFTQFDTGTLRAPFDNPAEICANPAGFYVNYHTAVIPTGAIRGQLTRLF